MPFQNDDQRKAVMANLNKNHGPSSSSVHSGSSQQSNKFTTNLMMQNPNIEQTWNALTEKQKEQKFGDWMANFSDSEVLFKKYNYGNTDFENLPYRFRNHLKESTDENLETKAESNIAKYDFSNEELRQIARSTPVKKYEDVFGHTIKIPESHVVWARKILKDRYRGFPNLHMLNNIVTNHQHVAGRFDKVDDDIEPAELKYDVIDVQTANAILTVMDAVYEENLKKEGKKKAFESLEKANRLLKTKNGTAVLANFAWSKIR